MLQVSTRAQSAQIETQGLLSRVSVRGTLTDGHDESTRVYIETPDTTPPDRIYDRQNKTTTMASNTERASCESAGARPNSDRRIQKLARTNRQAFKRRDATRRLTRVREPGHLMHPAVFACKPTATGSVIGIKHPSNRPFLQPCPPDESEHDSAQQGRRNVSSRPPLETPKVNAPVSKALHDNRPSSERIHSLRSVRQRKTAPQPP